ncbi:MAG: NAD(P)H-hydrate dehydratase [Chloroflexota bacterium]|nr:NAD(P)H-hydrate dehydratase [Chloroflexota bacterium]
MFQSHNPPTAHGSQPTALVTAAEMRAIEARAAARGETSAVLMDRAARRIAEIVAAQVALPADRAATVLVLVGPGNNGGDGLWAAQYLRHAGWTAVCYLWQQRAQPDPALAAAVESGARILHHATPADRQELPALLLGADAVLDALLGFGLTRNITDDGAALIAQVQAAVVERAAMALPLPVFAVDVPTGIDSDSGAVRGTALPAAVTITLGAAKRGLFQFPGAAYAGAILLGDIGVADLTDSIQTTETTAEAMRALLPTRPADANKGTFGSVLIVAGSLNYVGAGVLAARGALRSGVGLATLATPFELLPMVAAHLIECTFHPLPSDMGALIDRSAGEVFKALGKRDYQTLLVGNGLGQEKETLAFMRDLLKLPAEGKVGMHPSGARSVGFGGHDHGPTVAAGSRSERSVGFGGRRDAAPVADTAKDNAKEGKDGKDGTLPPLVLDADGLNLLAQIDGWASHLPADSILTPHPGEMARLLGGTADTATVQADRVGTAQRAAADWGTVVVLKGARTVIAAPDGRVAINPAATPALATAGTGDVLAGVIAGLRAQGLTAFDAAVVGVYLHGRAGELVAEELGDAGALAGDIADALPYALHDLRLTAE